MTVRRLVVLALAAGVLLTIGALLDWSGVDYSSRLDRALAVAAGGLAIATATLAVVWRRRVLVLAIGSGLLGLNMAIVNIRDISRHDFEYADYPEASVGVGLYMVLAGGALALAVGLTALLPGRHFGAEKPDSS
jgi:Na+-transporting NADH:ubiquinone oxidoreductase subunit NqrE